MSPLGVHDLLRIDPALTGGWTDAPAWVAPAVVRAPWVVVRRACPRGGIPAGVRGRRRDERFAVRIDPRDIRERRTPFDLAGMLRDATRPLTRAATAVSVEAERCGLQWGAAGAFGFELASGVGVTHARSDLDLVVRPGSRAQLLTFAAACTEIAAWSGIAIDAEVLFAEGGVALAEYARTPGLVLAKTASGPALIACPA